MKYLCKNCGHEFEGLSFITKCEKCGSEKITRKAKKSSAFSWLIVLIFIGLVAFIVINIDRNNKKEVKESVYYSIIFHEIENFNEITFYLVSTDKKDTVIVDDQIRNKISLEISQNGLNYDLIDGKFYPCEAEIVRYQWRNDSILLTQKSYAYVDISEFSDNFKKSEKAKCKYLFRILDAYMITKDSLIVFTDHPDNYVDSVEIFLKSKKVYKTKSGDSLVFISINGKNGNYFKSNVFRVNKSDTIFDIWAIDKNFNDTINYIQNGKFIENKFYKQFIQSYKSYLLDIGFKEEEIKNLIDKLKINNIDIFKLNKDSLSSYEYLIRNKISKDMAKKIVDITTKKTEKIIKKDNFISDMNYDKKLKKEVIEHYNNILSDIENNWRKVYKYNGAVIYKNQDVKSFPFDLIQLQSEGKIFYVKDVIIIRGSVNKVIIGIR